MTKDAVGDVHVRHCKFGEKRDFYYPKVNVEDE